MLTGLSSNNDEPKMPLDKSQNENSSENSKDGQGLKKLGLFAVIIGDLVGFTGAGVALGYFAMTKWEAPWWVLLLSTSAGLCLAFYQLYKISQKEL
jgi:tetrahydromethanopterin S-methyltransferase subunit D